jgi:hypothetical protein
MPEVCDNARLGRGFVHHMRPSAGVHRWMSFERVLLGLVVAALALSCSREVPSDQPVPPPEAPPSISVTAVPPPPTPEPTTSIVPVPTEPSLTAEPGGELLIACYDPPFSASVLDRPADDELEAHPAAALLRSMIDDPGFETERVTEGWWKIADEVTQVWYLGRIADDTYVFFRITFGSDGWAWDLAGDCTIGPAVEVVGLSPATWDLDPAQPAPEPSSTGIDLLVTEVACSGGASIEDRLLQPAIVHGKQTVTIIVAAVALEEGGDCLANPAAPLRVELREPLGDRVLRGWEPPPEGTGG